MNRLKPIYELTIEIKDLLAEDIPSKGREDTITQLNELIKRRGSYIDAMSQPFDEEEKRLGQKVISINASVQSRMQALFSDLKKDIQSMKKQKKSNRSYINPYKDVQTMDGMFMDKKK